MHMGRYLSYNAVSIHHAHKVLCENADSHAYGTILKL
ncbi:hypothetical protein ANAPC5_00666 [Anaplasma phagocytophilum]|nr:hypothetical protein ANAPC4_00043 [Anaplasma phagocytophilum]SBO29938.1 hypothetical protein ANAPC2_00051 [Anaplasma phagocytophilum]SBO30164.1 hypothetical protein ANAPC3_00116 [Anaplasma phagocytophilum]SCV63760.1 hypothetical protein ANAPC5_00666 [Anaplasma phagocytophilum]